MIVRPEDWIAMPWKNGRGTTHQIWKDADPFTIRFSVAEVSADGPFSQFEGIDRVIALLEGKGFELRGPMTRRCTDVGGPFAFRGEDRYDCHLLDGPVRDFNLMTARARWHADVHRTSSAELRANDFAFALTDGVRVGTSALGRHDLCRVDVPAHLSGPALVVALRPRGRPSA
jgi:environmental stress-induced protein Ves